MPRAPGPKCRRRTTALDELDRTVEMNLGDGHAFGPWDLHSRADFARPWATWGPEITRRWIAAFPGSRPLAAYLLGEVEPPPWRPGWRPMRTIRGIDVVLPGNGFHKQEAELEHLDAIGLLTATERKAALARLDGPEATYHARYKSIADEQEHRRGPAPPPVDQD
jgi:hypothetical protein